MKRITFIRHGKSSWEYEVIDKFRPLNQKGLKDAFSVAKEFSLKNISVDTVFSSPASRALNTCCMVIETLSISYDKLNVDNQLYDFSGNQILSFIKMIDNNINSVIIAGHNNAMTKLVNQLGDTDISHLPTTGLVSILFNNNKWNTLEKGHTDCIVTPKNI